MTVCPVPENPDDVEAIFPDGSTPQDRMGYMSALRSYGYTPLILTGALRQTLMQHFCDPQNIMNARLRNYLQREGGWRDGQTSPIYIESLAKWRPELTEMRPAILLKEGNWSWQHKVIGGIADTDWRLGVTSHLGYWEGTHTIFAVGGESAETQILAIEVARLLTWFANELSERLYLHWFRPVQIGALSAVEEATENYVVPVNVAYVAEEVWNTQMEAPRLKRIVLEFDPTDYGLRQ